MNATISDISKILKNESIKNDSSFWGVVKDKIYSGDICTGYMVSLGDDDDIIECRRLAGANVGDTVLVTLTSNGAMIVTGRIDGDQDIIDTNTNIELNYSTTLATINLIYPVGSIYMSTSPTNPSTLFAETTWESYAQGRVLIGAGTSDRQFTAGATGGESTHLLTSEESGQKDTTTGSYYGADGGHTHSILSYYQAYYAGTGSAIALCRTSGSGATPSYSEVSIPSADGTHQHSIYGSNANNAHNNLQPYIVVYIWRRIR